MVHEVCEEEGGEHNLRDERKGRKKKHWGDTREHRVQAARGSREMRKERSGEKDIEIGGER